MVHVLARSERRFGHAGFTGSEVVGGRCVNGPAELGEAGVCRGGTAAEMLNGHLQPGVYFYQRTMVRTDSERTGGQITSS